MQKEHQVEAANDILTGLMKAFHFLSRPKPAPKPKYTYENSYTALHARRRLTREESAAVDSLTDQLRVLNPKSDGERIKEILSEIGKLPVKFVPLKRETRIDNSKRYPYASAKRGG